MKKAVSVSQLNMYIKMLLGNDEHLSDILVKGEISNFKLHHSGHMYFTLKDNKAAVKCVMFASYAGRLDFRPSDGMQITAAGYVSIYEKSGQYQLYVANMMEEGEGALYIKFEKLKKQLMEEGIFDESRKKPIPVLPDTIGVVTSATGSVIKDIINVLDRRYPKYKMLLYPSHVQGKGAEIEIASGIRYFNEIRPVDVIIIARGGGSIEDLWPFNEEYLARTIYASAVPVISAVGHETDFTIDMVPSGLIGRYSDSEGNRYLLKDYELSSEFFDGKFYDLDEFYKMNITTFVQEYLEGLIDEPEIELILPGFSSEYGILWANNGSKSPKFELVLTDANQ